MDASAIASSPLVLALPTFLLTVLLQLWLDPPRVFTRLRCYHAATSAAAAGGGGRPVRPRGKKGARQQDSNDYDLGGAESLIVTPLSRRLVAQLKHLDAFNNLAMAGMAMLISLGLGQAAERLLVWPPSVLPPALAFSTVFAALAMLAKVDLLSDDTSPANKVLAATWGILGLGAALALHVLQPGNGRILAWDMQRAAKAVGPSVNGFIQAAAGKALQGRGLQGAAENIPQLSVSDSALQVLLALVAAAFAVLLFAPAQRFVRSFFLQLRPPEWAADYIAPRPLPTAGLALHFLLPALTALLWVRPMLQELLQLPDRTLSVVQAGALLLTAAAMGANQRTLLQRYLDRALTGWHQLKHGSRAARGTKDEKRTLGDVIRVHCQVTNHLLGKAAVQSLGPAVLYLNLGLLLLHTVLHPAAEGSSAMETQVLLQSCIGFLAFWTGACWFLYCAVLLWLFRTGVLQP
ncbi:hypothetical protein ABPG75_006798 [Micractinium tetrahymenae]